MPLTWESNINHVIGLRGGWKFEQEELENYPMASHPLIPITVTAAGVNGIWLMGKFLCFGGIQGHKNVFLRNGLT